MDEKCTMMEAAILKNKIFYQYSYIWQLCVDFLT